MLRCAPDKYSVKIELRKDYRHIQSCISYINAHDIKKIWVEALPISREPLSLKYIGKIKNPERIECLEFTGNFLLDDAVYHFPGISSLFYFPYRDEQIDVSQYPFLREITTSSIKNIANLDASHITYFSQIDKVPVDYERLGMMRNLTDLRIYGSLDFSFSKLKPLKSLKSVYFTNCNIQNFQGIEKFYNLRWLSALDCPSLSSIEGISLLPNLERVQLDTCPSLVDLSELGEVEFLNVLMLRRFQNSNLSFLNDMACKDFLKFLKLNFCNKIPSVKFLDKYPELEAYSGYGTAIEDCDLSPLLRLMSVAVTQDERYNYTDDELPFTQMFEYWWKLNNDYGIMMYL